MSKIKIAAPRSVLMMSVLAAVAMTTSAVAQNYPTRPIRIVTGGTGGGNDIASRLVAQGLTASWGQQVIVDNRPSGVIPGQIVAKSAPDGYTLVVYGSSFWIAPFLQPTPYEPLKDFAAISLAVSSPNILVINPNVPAHTVRELIAVAKAKPGQLNYGSSGTGASNHLAGELFNVMAGVNIIRVNYKSPGAALNDVIGGQVQIMFASAAAALPQMKSGRIRALAVTSLKPSQLAPELPTVTDSGLPGYEAVSPYGFYAPAKTPAAVISKLNQEIVRVVNQPEIKEKFLIAGIEVVGSSPSQLIAVMQSDMTKMGKLIKDANIHAD